MVLNDEEYVACVLGHCVGVCVCACDGGTITTTCGCGPQLCSNSGVLTEHAGLILHVCACYSTVQVTGGTYFCTCKE